jgi:hypothetical protein
VTIKARPRQPRISKKFDGRRSVATVLDKIKNMNVRSDQIMG